MLARNERSTTHLHVISQEARTPPGPDSSEWPGISRTRAAV
jgi:hypothetical protein